MERLAHATRRWNMFDPVVQKITPWKTNMDPENHWLVEQNTLPGGHCQGLC